MHNNYIELTITTNDTALNDLLIGELSNLGFDGFEEQENGLLAFCPEADYQAVAVEAILSAHPQLVYNSQVIVQQNWNALWESNFSPIAVDDFVGVRASFHTPITDTEHEIVITPKMSFGTGHHATTYMMMLLMRDLDFKHRTVFDFGTGTGILAILAEKLGGINILAVDYDDWCIENATENIATNNCHHITIKKADTAATEQPFDIVIANINKNIILDNVASIAKAAAQQGYILLSGLLEEDEADILQATQEQGLSHLKTITRNNWIAILLKH